MRTPSSLLIGAALLACVSWPAQGSTRIACDWGGIITSEPESRQIVLENGSQTTQITFDMQVTRSAKTRHARSDSSCAIPGEGDTQVALTHVFLDRKKGDPVAIRYLYSDNAGIPGRSHLLLIDCSVDRSTVCPGGSTND